MHVTESLVIALESLKSNTNEVLIWADAVRINQKDPIEKSEQVQFIRDIYKAASRVVIWLGPSTPETCCTIKEMDKLGGKLLDTGVWDLTSDDILHWDTSEVDTSTAATTKRAITKFKNEHLPQARDDQFPFWWVMSDLRKRKWFHVGLHRRSIAL